MATSAFFAGTWTVPVAVSPPHPLTASASAAQVRTVVRICPPSRRFSAQANTLSATTRFTIGPRANPLPTHRVSYILHRHLLGGLTGGCPLHFQRPRLVRPQLVVGDDALK